MALKKVKSSESCSLMESNELVENKEEKMEVD